MRETRFRQIILRDESRRPVFVEMVEHTLFLFGLRATKIAFPKIRRAFCQIPGFVLQLLALLDLGLGGAAVVLFRHHRLFLERLVFRGQRLKRPGLLIEPGLGGGKGLVGLRG